MQLIPSRAQDAQDKASLRMFVAPSVDVDASNGHLQVYLLAYGWSRRQSSSKWGESS